MGPKWNILQFLGQSGPTRKHYNFEKLSAYMSQGQKDKNFYEKNFEFFMK